MCWLFIEGEGPLKSGYYITVAQIYNLTLRETQKSGYLVLFEYFRRQTYLQDIRLSSFSGWPLNSVGSVLSKPSFISDGLKGRLL